MLDPPQYQDDVPLEREVPHEQEEPFEQRDDNLLMLEVTVQALINIGISSDDSEELEDVPQEGPVRFLQASDRSANE